MYAPKQFALDDLAAQHAVIEACDFGIAVSNGEGGLFATHIPMLLVPEEGICGTLYGHMARANPHPKLFDGSEVLVIFNGPHGYVSPTWYSDRTMNVPTWNYVAVHAYGVPETLPVDGAGKVLEKITRKYEASRPNGWSMNELKENLREMLPQQVVAFRLPIARIEGKAKLSQNKPRSERERVIEELRAAGETKLARRMEDELVKELN
ncbi:MAG: FMN-binding negative transcriptional regulator [Alphaproteobacteria bacterium]|nr:FMN-binding negative transcriptional regulator [Alphaproteobacteria bacterium]